MSTNVKLHNLFLQGSGLYHYRHNNIYVWNIAVGTVCLAALTAVFATFIWRVHVALMEKRAWSVNFVR